MHLVVDKMVQLHEVDYADRDRVLEMLASASIADRRLRVYGQAGVLQLLLDLLL